MTVSTILAGKGREVISVEPSASLADAVRLLAKQAHRRGSHLRRRSPYRRHHLGTRHRARPWRSADRSALDEPVSRTMTRKVETCNATETVSSIMERMTVGQVSSCARGRSAAALVGIVSIGDIVKHRLHEMERELEAMRDYIATA